MQDLRRYVKREKIHRKIDEEKHVSVQDLIHCPSPTSLYRIPFEKEVEGRRVFLFFLGAI
jgi:hypothetical protein